MKPRNTLVEEYAHARQILDGLDVGVQKQQFPDYAARPYEQDAKQIATEVLGYTPEN